MNTNIKLILVIFVSFWSCKESHDFMDLNKNSKMDIFEDPNIEAEERAKDILSYLSIEEKIAQLESSAPSIPKLGITKYNWMNEALHGIRGDH